MKHKVLELEGAALALAVAQCVGDVSVHDTDPPYYYGPPLTWERCGPIIERELIVIIPCEMDGAVVWVAILQDNGLDAVGDWFDNALEDPATTPLIAAMRAYIAGTFGEEIEL